MYTPKCAFIFTMSFKPKDTMQNAEHWKICPILFSRGQPSALLSSQAFLSEKFNWICFKSSFSGPRLPPLACEPSYSSRGGIPITSQAPKPTFKWGTWPAEHYIPSHLIWDITPSYLREAGCPCYLQDQPSIMELPALWLIFPVSDWSVSKHGVREVIVICHLSWEMLKIHF